MKLDITSSIGAQATDFALMLANSYDPARHPSDLLTDRDGAARLLGPYLTKEEDPARIASELTPFRDVLRATLIGAVTGEPVAEECEVRLSESLELPWRVVDAAFRAVSFQPDGTAAQRLSAWAALGYFALIQDVRSRLRVCDSAPCEEIFRDDTKAGQQRFCSKRCANRFNVARHRDRQRISRD